LSLLWFFLCKSSLNEYNFRNAYYSILFWSQPHFIYTWLSWFIVNTPHIWRHNYDEVFNMTRFSITPNIRRKHVNNASVHSESKLYMYINFGSFLYSDNPGQKCWRTWHWLCEIWLPHQFPPFNVVCNVLYVQGVTQHW
jgi:hypothetical protein